MGTVLQTFRGILALVLHGGNSLFWCLPLYGAILLRLPAPRTSWGAFCDRLLDSTARGWIGGALLISRRLSSRAWALPSLPSLRPDGHYLVLSNHQSWVDIFVLLHLLPRSLPFPRFFTKKEMLWLPLLGVACWALDFPLMHRHSRAFLERNPHMRGRDLEATRRSCARLRRRPVTMVNFLEGTRFTPLKHARQASPYRHLLKPHSGGAALVVNALGEELVAVLDLTVAYPGGVPTFWDFLCGRLRQVRVDARVLPVPAALRGGDYQEDGAYRRAFQSWIGEIWSEKDRRMGELLGEASGEKTSVR